MTLHSGLVSARFGLADVVKTSEQSDLPTSAAAPLPDGFCLRIKDCESAVRVPDSADDIVWTLPRVSPFSRAVRFLVGQLCCSPELAGREPEFSESSFGFALDGKRRPSDSLYTRQFRAPLAPEEDTGENVDAHPMRALSASQTTVF